MVGLTRKSFDGLALPTVLWTRSIRVYGVVGTYAGGQRSASSRRLCSLSYYIAVRHGHLTVTWRGVSMSLVRNAFAGSWGSAGMIVSNQRLRHETESRPVTSIVREHQLGLYGHVARLPDVDPGHRVLSVRDNPRWRRQRGRPRNSWLGKVDQSCRELLGMGRMGAWVLARRDRPGWRGQVSDAMCPPPYAPH